MNDSELTGRVLISKYLTIINPFCLDNYMDYFGTMCTGDHKEGKRR